MPCTLADTTTNETPVDIMNPISNSPLNNPQAFPALNALHALKQKRLAQTGNTTEQAGGFALKIPPATHAPSQAPAAPAQRVSSLANSAQAGLTNLGLADLDPTLPPAYQATIRDVHREASQLGFIDLNAKTIQQALMKGESLLADFYA